MTSVRTSTASNKPGLKAALVGLLPVIIIVLGLATHVQTLRWGFLYDDFIHQSMFRYWRTIPGVQPWDLYDFGFRPEPGEPMYQSGLFPWWTAQNFKVRYFRPVTSLSIYLDFLLYHDWAPGYHLTNLLLYAAILGFAYKLYLALGISRRAALWALAFLAFEGTHVVPVGWIANRNTLIAVLFTLLTMLAFHRYHLTRRRRFFLLSILFFLLALGGKELGVICLPLIGLYLLFIGRPEEPRSFVRAGLKVLERPALWVFALIALGYFTGYALAGRGENSALYAVPWHDPLVYARRLVMLIPLAFSSLFFGLSTDLVFTHSGWALPMILFSLPLLLFTGIIFWRRLRSCPPAGFALGWAVFALIPGAGVFLSDRLLVGASPGTALLLGLFMDRLGSLNGLWTRRQFASMFLFCLIFLHLAVSIPMNYFRGHIFYKIAATDRANIMNAEIPLKSAKPRYVFLLNTPSAVLAMTIMPTWVVTHDDPGIYITYLQMARRELEWRRTSETSAVLTFGDPPFLDHQYELLFQTKKHPPPPGTRYKTAHFSATLLETESRGIRSVRFDFLRSLDDPSYFFLAWENGRLLRIKPPRIGQTLKLTAALPAVPFTP